MNNTTKKCTCPKLTADSIRPSGDHYMSCPLYTPPAQEEKTTAMVRFSQQKRKPIANYDDFYWEVVDHDGDYDENLHLVSIIDGSSIKISIQAILKAVERVQPPQEAQEEWCPLPHSPSTRHRIPKPPQEKEPETTWEERFKEELVEMNIFLGRDMQNRPPLYETSDEKVEEIKEFIRREINNASQEAATKAREEVIQEIEQMWPMSNEEVIDNLRNTLIKSLKNSV